MVHTDDVVSMAHTSSVTLQRNTSSNVADTSGSAKQAHSASKPRNNQRQQRQQKETPRKDGGRRKSSGPKHQQKTHWSKPNSNQRSQAERSDEENSKKPRSARKQQKVFLLTRDGPDSDKLSPLGSAFSPTPEAATTSKKRSRNRRRQQSPGDEPTEQRTPPRRPQNRQSQKRPMSTPAANNGPPLSAPTLAPHAASVPAAAAAATNTTPVRGGSPSSRHLHYAGASFNNSPAASTLPLPPSFLATPTKQQQQRTASPLSSSTRTRVMRDEDVFGTVSPASSTDTLQHPAMGVPPPYHMPVAVAFDERSRQLDAMLNSTLPQHRQMYQQPIHSYSAVDISSHQQQQQQQQQPSDMSSMFQKLRLAMNVNERPATVTPMTSGQVAAPNAHHLITPVYNA
ncbi:hypothetical protein BX667DRAFT_130260 [Coemansia mojavensis]|nr:hypothetical protein BX667DRAFT_130260 [Coemansia mojavensis]